MLCTHLHLLAPLDLWVQQGEKVLAQLVQVKELVPQEHVIAPDPLVQVALLVPQE